MRKQCETETKTCNYVIHYTQLTCSLFAPLVSPGDFRFFLATCCQAKFLLANQILS